MGSVGEFYVSCLETQAIPREHLMPMVRMYTTGICPYCQMAEQLLRRRGVTRIERIRVDQSLDARDEMIRITGRRTVPQIFIGEKHIGGFDDLAALDRQGELLPLLQEDPPALINP